MLRRTVLRWYDNAAARDRKFQVAIVGSGPGGCYVANSLLKQRKDVHVDIFEKLPVPFGLSRYGVAPDHPEVKNVEKTFLTMLEERPKDVSLLTNITVGGGGIPLALLQEHYGAVVLAHGAASVRTVGVPGEKLGNVFHAKSFVEYYNTMPLPYGNPTTSPFELDKMRRIVIIGNGNVALDCARALGAPYKHFCPTDMNCFAVREIMNSQVEEIVVVGRRDVEHAAFTTGEFREIANISNSLKVVVEPFDLPAALDRVKDVRGKKRQLELMHKYCPGGSADKESVADGDVKIPTFAARSKEERQAAFSIFSGMHQSRRTVASAEIRRRVHFVFNLKPKGFVPHPANKHVVGAVEFEALDGTPMIIPCDGVLNSVGYRSTALSGAPFDEKNGVIPNKMGRVEGGKRLYAAGWAKTGPRGVILATLTSSNETATAISADLDDALRREVEDKQRTAAGGGVAIADEKLADGPLGATNEGKYGLVDVLVQRQLAPMSLSQVKKIWKAERQRGVDLGKTSEKVQSVQDMIDIAAEGRMARRAKDRFLGNAAARPRGLEMLEDWLDEETEIIDLSDPKRTNPQMNIRL
jgi:adrenodoxin-NADP+ reductase